MVKAFNYAFNWHIYILLIVYNVVIYPLGSHKNS